MAATGSLARYSWITRWRLDASNCRGRFDMALAELAVESLDGLQALRLGEPARTLFELALFPWPHHAATTMVGGKVCRIMPNSTSILPLASIRSTGATSPV